MLPLCERWGQGVRHCVRRATSLGLWVDARSGSGPAAVCSCLRCAAQASLLCVIIVLRLQAEHAYCPPGPVCLQPARPRAWAVQLVTQLLAAASPAGRVLQAWLWAWWRGAAVLLLVIKGMRTKHKVFVQCGALCAAAGGSVCKSYCRHQTVWWAVVARWPCKPCRCGRMLRQKVHDVQ